MTPWWEIVIVNELVDPERQRARKKHIVFNTRDIPTQANTLFAHYC